MSKEEGKQNKGNQRELGGCRLSIEGALCESAQSAQLPSQSQSSDGPVLVTLVLRSKMSKFPRAQMPEGWSLLPFLLESFKQTAVYLQLHVNLQVSIYRNNVKRMVGWVIRIIIKLLAENKSCPVVTEDGLTLGGGHTVQHTDLVSQKCALETYMILLTNVTLINLIKIFFKLKKLLRPMS